LKPAIVHTRNLPGLEYLVPSALAGVPARIHGEHGRDMYDLDGLNRKYIFLRKVISPFVQQYIAVSTDLANWLVQTVGIRAERVAQIYNGVDLQRFYPRDGSRPSLGLPGFVSAENLVIGTVGRMETVKNQLTLVQAFLELLDQEPKARKLLRLVIIGDGPLRMEAEKLLKNANADHIAWLPGERNDIPEVMRGLDLFVLPSLREGMSNTILEAMASGLPVVATLVGGNPELVEEGKTGMLVPASDPVAMADAIRCYVHHPELLTLHGQAGRKRAEDRFSMEKMVHGYLQVYDSVLNKR
jgi:sugar transferase (PEP-CTERM/EpsH1 system associated)